MHSNRNKFVFVTIYLLLFSGIISAQNGDDKIQQLKFNKLLYAEFQKFYTNSIRQEEKNEWREPYFKKIDQINGVHYLDYNNDGSEDALVEFSVRNSDGGSFYFLVAVLFEKINDKYRYKAHFLPRNRLFEKFSSPFFLFSGKIDRLDEITTSKYKLLNKKFQEVKQ